MVYVQGVPTPSAVGTVVDPSQKLLSGVPVEVTGPKGTTFVVTDETGKWSLYNLSPGDYQAKPMSVAAPADKAKLMILATGLASVRDYFADAY